MKTKGKYLVIVAIIILILQITNIIISTTTSITINNQDKKEICEKCTSGKTVFFGDSITKGYNLEMFYDNENYLNKGINGETADDLLKRIKEDVLDYNPKEVFLMIGTNDIAMGQTDTEIISNIEKIIFKIEASCPNTKIYIESIYPVSEKFNKNKPKQNSKIEELNITLKSLANFNNLTYIDINSSLINEKGYLNTDYTVDGLHLNEKGYTVVTNILKEYL